MKKYPVLNPDKSANMQVLEEMYQRAVNIQMKLEPFSIHPKGEVRFGASESLCARKVFLNHVRPQYVPAFGPEILRKFRVGDIFHEMADRGIEDVLWDQEGDIVKIAPFRLRAFPELFEGLLPDCVSGTPDHILWLPAEGVLVLVDQKSANDWGFAKNKKDGASAYHAVQVGTYLDGLMRSPLKHVVTHSSMCVCYMSKDNIEISVQKVGPSYVQTAKGYWSFVANAMRTNDLPPALPMEPWACGLCPFFGGVKKEVALERCSGCVTLQDIDDQLGPKQ